MGGREEEDEKGEEEGGVWRACGDVNLVDVEDDEDVGYPAYSHHDRFPPWWVFVRDDNGGNLSCEKIPPLHNVQFG